MCETSATKPPEEILSCSTPLSHPVKYFTNSSVGQILSVKGKFPFLQNIWVEMEYQLDEYRITNSAHTEHL
jgi:hypothetical protein